MTIYTPELGDRITTLLAEFKLSSAAEQMTRRVPARSLRARLTGDVSRSRREFAG
jgi:hypothetical protein